MRDFLKYYNCLNVQPLHDDVKNLILFYKHEKIDLLKEILTLSGAANKIFHKFNRCEAIFRFGERHKPFYNLVRKQILGGPSLVFSRYEKVNESSIGENQNNIVKSKVGYDGNTLCLYAIGGNIPTGLYTNNKPISGNRLQPHRHPLQLAE